MFEGGKEERGSIFSLEGGGWEIIGGWGLKGLDSHWGPSNPPLIAAKISHFPFGRLSEGKARFFHILCFYPFSGGLAVQKDWTFSRGGGGFGVSFPPQHVLSKPDPRRAILCKLSWFSLGDSIICVCLLE